MASERQNGLGVELRDRIIAAIAKADQDWCSDRPVHEDMADAVIAELYPQHICELCGRTGTQKFSPTSTGWVCRNIYACNRRVRKGGAHA